MLAFENGKNRYSVCEWKRYGALHYHCYVIPDGVQVKNAVAFAYSTFLE